MRKRTPPTSEKERAKLAHENYLRYRSANRERYTRYQLRHALENFIEKRRQGTMTKKNYIDEAFLRWKIDTLDCYLTIIRTAYDLYPPGEKRTRIRYIIEKSKRAFEAHLQRHPEHLAAIQREQAAAPVRAYAPPPPREYVERPLTLAAYEAEYIKTMAHAQPKPTADPTPCNRCRWFLEQFAPCDFSSGVRHACAKFQNK